MHSPNTQDTQTQPGSKNIPGLTWLALVLGLACVAAVLLAALGYRSEALSLGTAVQSIRWAATAALAGVVVALLALFFARKTEAKRKVLLVAGAALVLNALVAAPPLYLFMQARSLPLIHDISTDMHDPPQFVAIAPLRSGAPNPMDYDPANAAEQQRAYPDIAPLVLPGMPPAQAVAHAERAARAMGWDVVSVLPQEGRLEATDSTPLLGFKDDIVVRVRESAAESGQGPGSVVDVRSVSRVGLSDIGTNAKRIRAFMRELQAQQ